MESQVTQPGPASHSMLKGGRSNRRAFKDKAAQIGVTIGGTMVFVALLLIFFYLLYVIKPIFDSADVTPVKTVSYQHADVPTLMVGAEEQNEVMYRVAVDGQVDFYTVADGSLLSSFTPPLPAGVTVTSAAVAVPSEQRFALGLSNGQVLVAGLEFGLSYPNNKRLITPKLRYPAGETPITVDETGSAIHKLTFTYSSDKMSFAYQDESGVWRLTRLEGQENMMTEEVEWVSTTSQIQDAPKKVSHELMTPDQRQLMLQTGNKIFVYDIRDTDSLDLLQVIDVERAKAQVNNVALLAGASSLLVSYDTGIVAQYFQVSGPKGRLYQEIRQFDDLPPIESITSEFYRKSFATVSPEGELTLLYTTSHRELFDEKFDLKNPGKMGFTPRSNGIVVEADKKLHIFSVENSHPEVSWSAMWDKVWYEGYPEPKYVWQSTSGSDDFEAKLSLMPLAYGTMKAAFYAMLFAVPLAIAGAIYTAYFMSPKVRGLVKPTIEIMEALPTVILGFLAGLWLAPLIEEHLPGILILLTLLPTSILASAYGWSKLPAIWKQRLPEVYQELMLIPVVCFVGWFSFAVSPIIEVALFDGNTRQFITNELGITFDQRNALVVGIAMGFAVIPTIFSIAEDAIFSVPRHLSNGSLALGATPWQTLTRVVLLTASPGIFSAIMMGLGRAVGETMIVLMATGNTAIMEWSVFEGMRTLAANIAVEMPESAIGSSHYRVLFLAAFVLFIFTFFFNTIAEVVRQRLRERYSSL
ncbi:ABC transporter permease subunit [Shewanella baltica]|jgi:phosphate transport system permease protein|uniref:Binding-protein-dependent transport systems inner membrane component n=1 Tax=Shewanella baltica (strain OS155 / ATCC BAA-1091) TaxID=325240 RepID=A3D2T9_SHEB5|nr:MULTISPECIES: ABC transporter permease subunit [Shewanella]ABN61052.1 binding-protein-dependent transport systems inner membrane component [Shewanella baltica OS155]ABS07681.1 binding-protein-dependent transport systems inner membrane component [Shewanella baltica OS185]AEH13399.1 ABC-type transporter, integral membrane subunit [Shewanella baltica OS117]KZK69860.1 phosphate ABC transporter permease [Shewanella baltica]MCB2383459.1 ABC transporter permease subunit [Shewanella sp. SR1]